MPNSRASDQEQQRAPEQEPAPAGPAEPAQEAQAEAPASEEVRALREETEQLRARVAELDDRWKRALADLDNYRKRAGRDIERRVAEERESLLREWLNTLDVVERALQMGSPGEPTYQGLLALLEQLEATLARHGVTRMGAAGETFDPAWHEAVAVQETTEVPAHTIVESTRSGFALGDRVLRPAQVVVARRPEQAE